MPKERPILSNLIQKNTSEIEGFQNKVLRPIIKMQHHLIIASFKNYLTKRKIEFSDLSKSDKLSKITSIFKTDNNYKNINLGFIIGHFSSDEFIFYADKSSEINRRILQIIMQRIQDSILEIS